MNPDQNADQLTLFQAKEHPVYAKLRQEIWAPHLVTKRISFQLHASKIKVSSWP